MLPDLNKCVYVCMYKHSLAYLSMRKWLVGTSPFTWKFGRYWLTPCKTLIFNLFSLVAAQP